MVEEDDTADADVVVVSYGITSRVAQRGIDVARAKGLKVGKLRLMIVWPFPDALIRELAKHVKAFVVPELNLGQMVARGRARRGRSQDRSGAARRGQRPPARGHPEGHPGGVAMSEEVDYECAECSNPVEPFLRMRPHASYLVSGLRHRHHGQLLHPRPYRFQG